MTISTLSAKSRYAGDGSTTSFPTGFMFFDSEHVRVILRREDGSEARWTEGSEYSLSGAGQPGGGTVEVATSPADHTPSVGETLVVKLAVPPRQETALPLGGAFPSTAVEAMADLAALRDQALAEALSRAVKFKETSALADVALPEPEAGRPIGWNGAGDALVNLAAAGRWQGDWATATDYAALDVVRDAADTQNIYVCEVAHTSGTFATDLAAEKWSLAIDVEAVEVAQAEAEASAAAAAVSEASAGDSAAAAAASASAAAASETSAGNSATAAAASASTASTAATTAETAEANAETAQAAAAASAAAAATSETNAAASEAAAAASATQVADAKLIWQGDWSSATPYAVNDAVAQDGTSWLCIQAHADQEPPNAVFWDVLAAKGATGDQGDPGADGLGVPPGGAAAQVLRKASNADNDTEWGNPAAAPVDSVFGRTGAVAAGSGDYNADQISETASNKIMTAAERAKLTGIAAGAEVNPAVPTQNQAEDGGSTTEYSWTPQRVHQAAKDAVPWSLTVAVGDETTAITTGTGKITFRLPHAVSLAAVRASLTAASSAGAVTVDINEGGASILSTKLTIDQGEKSSTTAATPAAIGDATLADDAEITLDIDGAGTGAAGLKVTLIGTKTTT